MVSGEALREEFVPSSTQDAARSSDTVFNDIDLVAVQGLTSNPERTWTTRDDQGRTWMWLRDLLPGDLPGVRVQTFRYDSKWYEDPDHVSLRECGKRLLYALLADRTHCGKSSLCPTRRKRPLILIGSSFGGLVINEAIVLASQVKPGDENFRHEDCQYLLKAIAGIMYLGVPHRGSRIAKWGLRKSFFGNLRGKQTYPDNLRALALENTTLNELREDFVKLIKSSSMKKTEIFCFYETKGIQLGIVVEQSSACLDFAPFDSLAGNHFDMNKFVPGENYNRVLKRLKKFCNAAPSTVKQRYEWETYASPRACPQYQNIESFLGVQGSLQLQALDQLILRRDPDTCKWTDQHEVLKPWSKLDDKRNFAWIYGIPGSGKSVLAAAVAETFELKDEMETDCWREMSSEVCAIQHRRSSLPSIAYYFAGYAPENFDSSTMLSDLIHQCLVNHCDHQTLLKASSEIVSKAQSARRRRSMVMMDMLGEISRQTGGIRIVIDGFNELSRWTELIDILAGFQTNKSIRVLLVGHPNDQPLGGVLESLKSDGMAFDISQYTKADIKLYARKKVDSYRHKWPTHRVLADEIEEMLLRDNRGMYQWVALVLDVIDRYGSSEDDARQALKDFPTGLQQMYFKVFEKIILRPPFILRRVREALIFLAVNLSPISLQELSTYVETRIKTEPAIGMIASQENTISDATVESLRASLGSLVVTFPISSQSVGSEGLERRIQRHDHLIVELCHSTLRQLILQETEPVLARNEESLVKTFSSARSAAHQTAATTCIQVAAGSFKPLICSSYHALSAHEPALVHYAFQYWFSHLLASDFLEKDSVFPHVEAFFKLLIEGSATLIGALSVSIQTKAIKLGPRSGGVTKTVAIVDLETTLLKAAKALEHLSKVRYRPAFSAGQELENEDPASWSFLRKCKVILLWWKRRGYLSATALEILNLRTAPPNGLTEYEAYVDCSLDAVESLQMLALELSLNPIRWQLLQPTQHFSPVVPFLLAAHALESLMLWPSSRYLKLSTVSPWNAPSDNRMHYRLSCAVAEIMGRPDETEIQRRVKKAQKYYVLKGPNALSVAAYIALNRGDGLGGALKAPLINYWLNSKVHIGSNVTRGWALLRNPLWSFAEGTQGQSRALEGPTIMDAIIAFPITFALTLVAALRQSLQRARWWFWLGLRWNYTRLQLAYNNYSIVPRLLTSSYRNYLVPGLVLYLLRCKFWPTLGQHFSPNAYHQIQLAIVAPLDWVAEQSNWDWWDWVWYQGMYWPMQFFSVAHVFVPRTWPVLHATAKSLLLFQLILILERTVCQIVNAILTVAVPLMILIQPSTPDSTSTAVPTFKEVVWTPLANSSTTIFLLASVRMSIPFAILYWLDKKTLAYKILQPYIIACVQPMALTFSVLASKYFVSLLFRPTAEKDPADTFLVSLIGTAAMFLLIHVEAKFENDPWRLDLVWRGFKRTTKIAQQVAGREIKPLDAEIARHRLQNTIPEDVLAAAVDGNQSTLRTGPLSASNVAEDGVSGLVNTDVPSPDGELH